MSDLQFVYPWSAPLYAGLSMLVLGISCITGFYFIYRSFKTSRKSRKAIWIIVSIPFIGLPLFNFIGYRNQLSSTYEMYSGTYIGQSNVSELKLLENNKWTSKGLSLECSSGNWELGISEEGTWIELSCEGKDYTTDQLWPNKDFEVRIDEEVVLNKLKTNPNK